MTVEEYWKKLWKIGWLDYLPKSIVDEVHEHLKKNLADGTKYGIFALSTAGFDTECIDDDHSYSTILAELAEASLGEFVPKNIKEKYDSALEIAEISFEHKGKVFAAEVPFTSDWFEMEVLDLVNDALAAGKSACRFIPLPALDQILNLVFIPPSIYEKAAEEKLVSKKNSYLTHLRKNEKRQLGKKESHEAKNQPDKKLLEMFKSEDPIDRMTAVIRMGSSRAKATQAFSILVEALQDNDFHTRVQAADALPRVGIRAVPFLEKLLADPDGLIRVAGATNLLKITKHDGALAFIMQALRPEGDESIKGHILHALGHMGPTAEPALPALIVALDDSSPCHIGGNRGSAFNVLQILGPLAKPAIPKLLALIRKGECVGQAAYTLGTIGPAATETVPDLIKVLEIKSERASAVTALGMIGPGARDAIPFLINALTDSGEVPRRAAESLGQIGPPAPEAIPGLLKLLKSESSFVCLEAAKALSILDPLAARAAIPVLVQEYQEHGYNRKEIAQIANAIDPKLAKENGLV